MASNITRWIEAETRYAAGGVLDPHSVGGRSIEIRAEKGDAPNALIAISGFDPASELERIRTLVSLGQLKEAEDRAIGLGETLESHPRVEAELIRAELLIERARICNSRARWQEALNWLLQFERLRHACLAQTHLTAHQMRGLAFLELGEREKIERELECAFQIAEQFPAGNSALYLKVMRSKAQLLFGTLSESSRADLKEMILSQPRPESALVWMRLESLRAANNPLRGYQAALAAMLIARRMGDRLYEALAIADAEYHVGGALPSSLLESLENFSREFVWVRAFRDGQGTSSIETHSRRPQAPFRFKHFTSE